MEPSFEAATLSGESQVSTTAATATAHVGAYTLVRPVERRSIAAAGSNQVSQT
jgi:hypothetical protein